LAVHYGLSTQYYATGNNYTNKFSLFFGNKMDFSLVWFFTYESKLVE